MSYSRLWTYCLQGIVRQTGMPRIGSTRPYEFVYRGRPDQTAVSAVFESPSSVKIAGVRIYLNVDQRGALSLKDALQCLVKRSAIEDPDRAN